MITEAIVNALHGLAVSIFAWLRDNLPAAPAFWLDVGDALVTITAMVPAQLLWFVPVVPVVEAGTAVLALIVGLGLLRLARRVLSLFTGGGGMA